MQEKLTGRQKAAALLILLGPDVSAEVVKQLRETDLDSLMLEVFNTDDIPEHLQEQVVDECHQIFLAQGFVISGGQEYAKDVLSRALGSTKAVEILSRLQTSVRSNLFDFVRRIEPGQLIGFLQAENPQTIALILAHLPPGHAASVFAGLETGLQVEVAKRVAIMDRTAPEVARQVEALLKKKLASVMMQDLTAAGGVEFLVKILNQVNRSTEKAVIDSLAQTMPDLADEVRKHMFVFEDITLLDDRAIQLVLRHVESKDTALALKGTKPEVKQCILRNLSERAAEMLEDDIAVMGPVRAVVVEEAQRKIVNVIRMLEDKEEIVISRGQQSDIIV